MPELTRGFLHRVRPAGIALAVALTLSACAAAPPRPAPAPQAAASSKDALYRDLGGGEGIAKVTDAFLARVHDDLRINLFFENTDLKDLRRLVIEQLCEATGGPCKYTGRPMEEAHSGLNLTDADFAAFVEDLVATLNEFKVPKPTQQRLLAILGPMKPQIVGQ
jgi:hemoglobin